MNIESSISQQRFFSAHAAFYIRELRILAYSQLLQSYRRYVDMLACLTMTIDELA